MPEVVMRLTSFFSNAGMLPAVKLAQSGECTMHIGIRFYLLEADILIRAGKNNGTFVNLL
ncbi:hypothetical protein UZ35_02945 [Heyndrickxia coagulans]|nr:hypothetical protein CIW84_03565 [Heyndrickxia coagulans]KGB29364.1 hypothetical protein IE89_11325 [Heyndrickxia coagulans]KXT21718.1 hypothetical protein UZ35_02945 [Heyndrickxia coagulans]OZV97123.1 hypothetical protein CAY57_03705 [Heyndrickxia coagulans]RCS33315.1 hypothetical protein DN050_08845 [Heyndrickxia coagulans]